MTYLKAWVTLFASLAVTGITAFNAATNAGFNPTTITVIALAVLAPLGVAITSNTGTGLDAHAKALVSGVIFFLIGLLTFLAPLVTNQPLDSNALIALTVAALGFIATYAAPNTSRNIVYSHSIDLSITNDLPLNES